MGQEIHPDRKMMAAQEMKFERDMAELIAAACLAGATEVRKLLPADIVVDPQMAEYCRQPGCPNYGLSPSCPPHVAGPEAFLELGSRSRMALVVRIEVPSAVLFSDERREVIRLLHEIVAGIERSAARLGYHESKSFAGGSCKDLFCQDHSECQVLSGSGTCRNPELARPSMSGFGVNVARTLELAGFGGAEKNGPAVRGETGTSWVAGLVLIV
jgi:predicted metal-binding protein